MANLQNTVMRLNNRCQLVIWCLLGERHFGAPTEKSKRVHITTQKMANLQDNVTRVFSQCYGAYHKRDTLELLREILA